MWRFRPGRGRPEIHLAHKRARARARLTRQPRLRSSLHRAKVRECTHTRRPRSEPSLAEYLRRIQPCKVAAPRRAPLPRLRHGGDVFSRPLFLLEEDRRL